MSNESDTLIRRVRIFRYLAALWKLWKSGKGLLPKEKILERFEICKKCEHFTGLRCTKCGCCTGEVESHFNKLAFPTEACPEGYFGTVSDLVVLDTDPDTSDEQDRQR